MENLLAILLVVYLASSKSLTTMYKGTKASCMPVLLSSIHTVCAMCINVFVLRRGLPNVVTVDYHAKGISPQYQEAYRKICSYIQRTVLEIC